jgi:3,4-dihydroxy 2-butanone 4-phosphate synthase/GTP cyclohydrolase II
VPDLLDDVRTERHPVADVITHVATATVPTHWGEFTTHAYRRPDGIEHLALVLGMLGDAPLVRVHSECLTGDVFASARCDCGAQRDLALELIAAEGRGALIYLRGQEGRGIGLGEKIRAYALQEAGYDTVDANLALGHPADARDYSDAAEILRHLGATSIRLLTNNPAKTDALAAHGIRVIVRESIVIEPTVANAAYLLTKRERMGHRWV